MLEGINLKLMTLNDVAKRIGVSKRTVQRIVSDGHLPRPKKVGGCSRWFSHDVELYLCRVFAGLIGDPSTDLTESAKTSRR